MEVIGSEKVNILFAKYMVGNTIVFILVKIEIMAISNGREPTSV